MLLDTRVLHRVEQRKRMFFKWLVLGKGGVDDVAWVGGQLRQCSFSSHGALERRAWCVCRQTVFFRNSDPVVTVQHLFRRKFIVERRGAIPDRNSILRWVEAFRTTGSFHPSRSRSCAAKYVGACEAGLWGEAPNVCLAIRTSYDWHYFPYVIWYAL